MFDRLLFVLFNIQPKPLAYTVTIDIHGDRYTIHSQKPVTITEKDSGYIQIKALGKMHIFCGKMLHISVKKNTTLVTIGWSKGKSQIFEVKKNYQDIASHRTSSSSNTRYVPPVYESTTSDNSHRASNHFCSNDNSSTDCSSSDSGGSDSASGD
ncbi:hypothetical protein U3C50_000776 [Providencia rettgeri]|nr:hypothetical protein [Providencia rettgeri]EIU9515541.1 hypothetical protein [Providencia rettgeri]ELR5093848.1 hypothetical protein [Providencia rettgeri]EMA4781082.1 hypothetical protein [Providencia rettgeri]